MATDPLLQPLKVGPLELKNRVMSASHEPNYTDAGMPAERYRLYHLEKAKGGIGLTMIGGSAIVSPDSTRIFGNIDVTTDDVIPYFQRLAESTHAYDCAVMTQLTHLGRRTTNYTEDWFPVVAPSCVREPAHRSFPKIAEPEDIWRIIGDFGEAARRCREGGLDGIELQAYGHLIDGFWSPRTNQRTDEWGGSFENRTRFAKKVIAEVRKRVGTDYVVGLRMAVDEDYSDGLATEEGVAIANLLTEYGGLDFVNVVKGHIDTGEGMSHVIANLGTPQGPQLDFVGDVRRQLGDVRVFHSNRVNDIATARYAIREGKVDAIGMTRAHMADPHIVNKVAFGEEDRIRPCVGAGYCVDRLYDGEDSYCIHNANTGRETYLPHDLEPQRPPRKVVVVGAGPAGLEAARVCAEKGHNVVVFEASDRAGGQVALACVLKRRQDLVGIIDWRLSEIYRLGVVVRYNTYAEEGDVLEEAPDVVISATGGLPKTDFLESGEEYVDTTWDALGGHISGNGSIMIYDDNGQHPALSCAEYLAESADSIEFVTPECRPGVQIGGTNYPAYARAIYENNIAVMPDHRLVRVEKRKDDGRLNAVFRNEYTHKTHCETYDHIIVDHGTDSLDELYATMKPNSFNSGQPYYDFKRPDVVRDNIVNPNGFYELFRVGDAVASRNIQAAILDAVRVCKHL